MSTTTDRRTADNGFTTPTERAHRRSLTKTRRANRGRSQLKRKPRAPQPVHIDPVAMAHDLAALKRGAS